MLGVLVGIGIGIFSTGAALVLLVWYGYSQSPEVHANERLLREHKSGQGATSHPRSLPPEEG